MISERDTGDSQIGLFFQNSLPEDAAYGLLHLDESLKPIIMLGLKHGEAQRKGFVEGQRKLVEVYRKSLYLDLKAQYDPVDRGVAKTIESYEKTISVWSMPDEVLYWAQRDLFESSSSE